MLPIQPNSWIILEINQKGEEPIYKILCSWYGGYGGGDEWKLNSGIKEVKREKDFVDFIGFSGSIYRCYRNSERFSGIMASVYDSFRNSIGQDASIEPILLEEFDKLVSASGSFDLERMQESIESESILAPSGMNQEEKRNFIISNSGSDK